MPDPSPFDDIRDLARTMPDPDPAAGEAAQLLFASAAPGLGRLAGAASWVAAWQGRPRPSADRALVCLFAATHAAARRGRPDLVGEARRHLDAFTAGHAPVNALCASAGLGFKAFDLALDLPTPDIAEAPSLDEKGCVATIAFGMEAIAGGTDILAVGDVGAGSDLAAAAILSALWGDAPGRWLDDRAPDAAADADTIRAALARLGGRRTDPLAVLAEFGGRDVAAMAGAILAAGHGRVPVMLDGFAAAAAAALLSALAPGAAGHCLAGHVSAHPHHAALLARLGLAPLLDGLALAAPGAGGAIALGLLKATLACGREGDAGSASPRPN